MAEDRELWSSKGHAPAVKHKRLTRMMMMLMIMMMMMMMMMIMLFMLIV